MLFLKKLSLNDGKEIYDMLQEIDSNDHGFHNKVYGMNYAEFQQWLKQEYKFDNGIDLLDWMVPQSSFWLFDGEIPVGYGRIRHYLNDNLKETSGHIGYAISKTYRGRKYGNRILSLLIEECKRLDMQQIQIGTNEKNVRSNKVILHNGGVLFRKTSDKYLYHIDLTK